MLFFISSSEASRDTPKTLYGSVIVLDLLLLNYLCQDVDYHSWFYRQWNCRQQYLQRCVYSCRRVFRMLRQCICSILRNRERSARSLHAAVSEAVRIPGAFRHHKRQKAAAVICKCRIVQVCLPEWIIAAGFDVFSTSS